jgi:hypothetical protein
LTLNDICFAANPDIAGIGVRIPAYAQTLVLVNITSLSFADGYINAQERKLLGQFSANLLITATSKMSLHHALIVLESA